MTLEGAINLNETSEYVIYTMNSVTTGQYGVVVPKNIVGTVNMLIDLDMKSTFDGVGNGTKTKEELVNEIAAEYNKLKVKYNSGMLVMPMLDASLFSNIVNNGDKQKMFDEVKKIGAITSELYKKMTESGIGKQNIDQKIIIIEKKNEDIKFVDWLRVQMPNFVDGILYSEFNDNNASDNVTSASVESDNIFGNATQEVVSAATESVVDSVPKTPVSGGIFDNVPPVVSTPAPTTSVVATPTVSESAVVESSTISEPTVSVADSVVPSISSEPVSSSSQVDFGNIFETKTEGSVSVPLVAEVSTSQPVEVSVSSVEPVAVESPVASVPNASNNGIFSTNNNVSVVSNAATPVSTVTTNSVPEVSASATNTSSVNSDVFSSPVQPVSVQSEGNATVVSNNTNVETQVVDGPKPVEGTALDNTTTFTSVVEQTEDNDGEMIGDANDNKSKGFVNLAILLVVIVAVTFISIEIGKYLYNTFGA